MRLFATFALASAVLVPLPLHAASPANAPLHFNADTARVYDMTADALTADALAAQGGEMLRLAPVDHDATLRSFLGDRGVDADTLKSLVPANEHLSSTGVTHTRYDQTAQGLPVYGSYAKAAFDATGRLVHLIDNTVTVRRGTLVRPALVDEAVALKAALEHHYPGFREHLIPARVDGLVTSFEPTHFFFQAPTVSRVAVPFRNGELREGFLVETWDRDNMLWHTVVGGHGEILSQELRTASDTYKIFPDHPGNSTQTVVSGAGSGNAQSPNGWVATNTTIGNNVDAYLDTDANNSADSGGRPVSSTQTFEYTANLSQAPSTSVNKNAAVASLFYWNNVIHDKLYSHGFTETAGNFQNNNFGQGGSANDRVLAEAQDGSGTNNANFATPADGSKPRMQMYVWTLTSPQPGR
jgi:extracellular elastinolytic metalloproteinase